MQMSPHYEDVVIEVGQFLADRLQVCLNHGIAKNRIVLDPGFGFGKTREHNISLIQQLEKLHRIGLPLLVGLSRKSVLGAIAGGDQNQRLYASIAAVSYTHLDVYKRQLRVWTYCFMEPKSPVRCN